MKHVRILGLCLLAAFATSATVAASAFAAPEFLHSGGPLALTGITGKSVGAVKIIVPPGEIKCGKEGLLGEVELGSTKNVEEVHLGFKGCKEKVPSTTGTTGVKCIVKSPGRPPGILISRRLVGELGEVALAEAADGIGLDLKPEVGTVVMRIEAPGCFLPIAVVEGSVIGEVNPMGPPETLEKNFVTEPLGVTIKKFVFEPKDTLEAFAKEVAVKSTLALKFEEVVEVT